MTHLARGAPLPAHGARNCTLLIIDDVHEILRPCSFGVGTPISIGERRACHRWNSYLPSAVVSQRLNDSLHLKFQVSV